MELLITILASILLSWLGREVWEALFKLSLMILRLAIRILPETRRERLGEEWKAHLSTCSSRVAQLGFAIGCVFAAVEIRRNDHTQQWEVDQHGGKDYAASSSLGLVAFQLNRILSWFQRRGDIDLVHRTAEFGVVILILVHGESSVQVRSYLLFLSHFYYRFGFFDRAERAALRLHERAEAYLRPDHPVVARALLCLGELYRIQGREDAAGACLLDAMTMLEKQFGKVHPDVAVAKNNIAMLLRKDDFSRSTQLFEEALLIANSELGDDHSLVATVAGNLAENLGKVGDLFAAQNLLIKMASTQEDRYGADSLQFAIAPLKLSQVEIWLREYDQANIILRDAKRILRVKAPNHPNLGFVYERLGDMFAARSENRKAKRCYGKAIKILRGKYGQRDARVHRVTNVLSQLPSE